MRKQQIAHGTRYYNEFDPKAAAWLRELIKEGHLPDGEVDERSILDVLPGELQRFSACHFFAGIGGWPLALKLAGWPADRPVWTGSCPCQSFSAAGSRKGVADERHLWPSWFHLISQCKPHTIFGEQVEAAIKHDWLDLVSSDLEGIGYEVGACGLPAASVGAPHIRARLWFVAESKSQRNGSVDTRQQRWPEPSRGSTQSRRGDDGSVGNAALDRIRTQHRESQQSIKQQWKAGRSGFSQPIADKPLVHTQSEQVGVPGRAWESREPDRLMGDTEQRGCESGAIADTRSAADIPSSTNSTFWSNSIFLPCIDGKARPTEPTIFPLAHGIPGRVGLLRGAGNAIVPQVAAAFIEAYLEICTLREVSYANADRSDEGSISAVSRPAKVAVFSASRGLSLSILNVKSAPRANHKECDEKMNNKFYGNKKTKVLHNSRRGDSCRKAEIKKENRQDFTDTEVARKQGFRLCHRCTWDE